MIPVSPGQQTRWRFEKMSTDVFVVHKIVLSRGEVSLIFSKRTMVRRRKSELSMRRRLAQSSHEARKIVFHAFFSVKSLPRERTGASSKEVIEIFCSSALFLNK